jgi:hypothetical protein
MSDQVRELTQRLERVERQNRRLLRWGGSALALVAGGLLMSMLPVCKTVWAERFVLQDPQGTERAVLSAYESGGTPQFSMRGRDGKTLATLSVDQDGAAFLSLFDAKGEKSLRLSVGADGSPKLESPGCKSGRTDAPKKVADKKDPGSVSMAR